MPAAFVVVLVWAVTAATVAANAAEMAVVVSGKTRPAQGGRKRS